MSEASEINSHGQLPSVPANEIKVEKSPGFWKESWWRFRKRKLSNLALCLVAFLALVAIFSPAIVGTKPIICKYKGNYYFPCMSYFNARWENPIFHKDKFRKRYPQNLKKKDPDSWAIYPLVFQDPYRRVRKGEYEGHPGNPTLDQGKPNKYNLFGTDPKGVDVFAQMVHGTRIALLVGFVSMSIAAAIGILVGAMGGFWGGWIDSIFSRITEVTMCIPTLVLILALLAIVENPTIYHLMAVIGITGWTGIARLTRGEFLKLKQMDFVAAAQVLGVSKTRIIFRHILPNSLAPILVPISFGIASAILTESGLSFLGFGAPPPTPSWGRVLNMGRENLELWWLITFPGAAIFLAVLAYNLIGEGVQAATDPRLRD